MRKTLLAIVAVAPLAALAGLAIPALAESGDDSAASREASCVSQPGEPAAGPIDLSTIPVKPVTGPQAVQGVGDDDECDDVSVGGQTGDDGVHAAAYVDDDGPLHEGRGELDD